MYCKLLIQTDLTVLTGMHIGGSSVFSAIGAVDSPVVRDQITNLPVIPGSSLKGKLRTLLARSANGGTLGLRDCNRDPDYILRMFGCSEPVRPSKLQFSDAFMSNAELFKAVGTTEIKFENSIDRVTAVANPRQIERVNAGAVFAVRIVYDADDIKVMTEDMGYMALAMKLLQLDYLGGHGSRGSGRVSFRNIRLSAEYSDVPVDITPLQKLFEQVEAYELLSV